MNTWLTRIIYLFIALKVKQIKLNEKRNSFRQNILIRLDSTFSINLSSMSLFYFINAYGHMHPTRHGISYHSNITMNLRKEKKWFNSQSRVASSFSIESLPQLILINDILYCNLFQSCFVASIRFAAIQYYYYLIGILYQINSYRALFTDFNKATIVHVNHFKRSCSHSVTAYVGNLNEST